MGFILAFISCDSVFEDDLALTAVEINSPPDNAELESATVLFNWDSVPEALTYNIEIISPAFDTENPDYFWDSTLTEFSFSSQLEIGAYEWRVKALNSSSETCFSESNFSIISNDDISAISPEITYPEEGSFINEETLVVSWEEMEEANEYLVKIYLVVLGVVSEEPTWSQITSLNSVSGTLDEGSYLLNVQGTFEGQNSLISEANFTVDRTSPTQPELLFPLNETINGGENITFTWTSGTDQLSSTFDSLFIYTVSPSVLVFSEAGENSYILSADELNPGNYDWSVITYDLAGNINESEVSIFSISE